MDHLQFLEDGELRDLCVYLRLLDADSVRPYESRDVIIAILVAHHVRRASQLEETKQISLYVASFFLVLLIFVSGFGAIEKGGGWLSTWCTQPWCQL